MDATPDIHERVQSRRSLHQRFEGRLSVDPMVTPKLVSYQGNYDVPGFRWMRYKEGFSQDLVQLLIQRVRPSSLLDPFSGIGTAPLVASGQGIKATGIKLIPVGLLVAQAISRAANTLESKSFAKAAAGLLDHISSNSQIDTDHAFPHIDITGHAFPAETESALARARAYISGTRDRDTTVMLNLACMSVLESVSFTQKDGQFLRWDRRSGKSPILDFPKEKRPATERCSRLPIRCDASGLGIRPRSLRQGSV